MKRSENWTKTIHKLKKNIDKLKKTIEKWKKTMETSMKIMDKSMKTMENSIKNMEQNPETSGKIDEHCKWEILATKCSKWEILAAKAKEGSLDEKKHCQLNSAPLRYSTLWIHFERVPRSPGPAEGPTLAWPKQRVVLGVSAGTSQMAWKFTINYIIMGLYWDYNAIRMRL